MTDSRISNTTSDGTQLAPGVWKMHLVIWTLGLFMVCIVGYGFYSGDRINTVDAPLVQAAMKIKLEASTTNLVLEGILGDGFVGGLEPVWKPLDRAFLNFRSIFNESKKRKTMLPFQANTLDSADIDKLESKLSEFKDNARKRFEGKRISLLDEDVDRIYRLAFKNLTGDLNKLEEKLRELMSKNLRLFRYSQTIMVILCVLLTLLAGIMFQRFERRQERAYRSLQDANEQLEKEIAERERSEKAVRASEERYRQIVKELKDFSTAVSHDLRAPLINLKGFSKEIEAALDVTRPVVDAALAELSEKRKKEVAAAFFEDLPEAVDFIDASVSKMERLINSILKLSRLDRRELKSETLDMKKIVQDTLKSLGHQIKARGIEVSVGNLPETPADKVAMEQILSNLLSNAINYLDPGRTGKIEITGESRPDENVFQIRDNGRGIQKFDIEKVFNLFERLGNDSAAGEGMGLAYVRALVRRHGGDVFCESEYGAGSKFTFTISKRIV